MTRPFYEYFPEYICTPKMWAKEYISNDDDNLYTMMYTEEVIGSRDNGKWWRVQ